MRNISGPFSHFQSNATANKLRPNECHRVAIAKNTFAAVVLGGLVTVTEQRSLVEVYALISRLMGQLNPWGVKVSKMIKELDKISTGSQQ